MKVFKLKDKSNKGMIMKHRPKTPGKMWMGIRPKERGGQDGKRGKLNSWDNFTI